MRLLTFTLVLFASFQLGAQPEELEDLYWYNRSLQIERIEREHFPLDGEEVDMIPFRQDSLFGLVEKEAPHDWIIEPQFLEVLTVYRDGAVVADSTGDYGLIRKDKTWLLEPYFDQIFAAGELYHGMIFGIIDTVKGLSEMYSSLILNVYATPDGETPIVEMAHDLGTFTSVDTMAWFRKGTDYRIRGQHGDLLKTFAYEKERAFLGIFNNRLVYQVDVEHEEHYYYYRYEGYTIDGTLDFSFETNYQWEAIIELSPGFFAASQDVNMGAWHFCNAEGEQYLFDYQHDEITYLYGRPNIYSMTHFPVVRPYGHGFSREMGLIDRTGKEVIPIIYRYVDEVVNGLVFHLSHEENGLSMLADTTGQLVVNKLLHGNLLAEPFQQYGKPIGFYDGLIPSTEIVGDGDLPPFNQNEEMEWMSRFTRFVYLNTQLEKKVVLDTGFVFAGLFSEGLAPVVDSQKRLGFVDKSGKIAITPEYSLAVGGGYPIPYLIIPEFKGGFAYIKAFKGYIDRNGRPFFAGKQLQDHYDFSH